jgi:hypothetical protein
MLDHYYVSADTLPRSYPKTVVCMEDGRIPHGGLSDRLRGIVSMYKLCREGGIVFKLHWTSPFNLSDYLAPNIYNWMIAPDEICYNPKQTAYFFLYDEASPYELECEAYLVKKYLKIRRKQIHAYTNIKIAENEYADLVNELFKPVGELKARIDYHVGQLGGDYISVAFRFSKRLGDFLGDNECCPKPLPEKDRYALLTRCIEHLKEIHSENHGKKVLVTADSITFVEEAKKLDFVYVIPGEIKHIDCKNDEITEEEILKVFLDYFVLAYSRKVYLVIDGQMYNSGFSCRAALHNKTPFIIRRYNDV